MYKRILVPMEDGQQQEPVLAHARMLAQHAKVDVLPRVVVTGLPPEEAILDLAAEEDVDLVVMATLPQSAVGRFLFGSVGEKVRRRARIPVLFLNLSEAEEGEE